MASLTSASVEAPVDKITASFLLPTYSSIGALVTSPDAIFTVLALRSSAMKSMLSKSKTEQRNPIRRSSQYSLSSRNSLTPSSSGLQRSVPDLCNPANFPSGKARAPRSG